MIKFDKVSLSIGESKIIKDISLEIKKGDFVAIIGENGAGKSTITKLIAGLIKPTSGTVFIDQMDTRKMRARDMAQKVSYLFQNPDKQICQKTVGEELLFGMEILDFDETTKKQRLEEVVSIFHLDPDVPPFSLSRGQRQMLTFASVYIMQPEVMILDEPTTGLDYKECMLMMGLVKKLQEKGTTIVMVSHDMEVVYDFAKKILVLSDGRKLALGNTKDIMCDEKLLDQASVTPSQIVALSLTLGTEFIQCDTCQTLVDEIERRCKSWEVF